MIDLGRLGGRLAGIVQRARECLIPSRSVIRAAVATQVAAAVMRSRANLGMVYESRSCTPG